MHIYMTRGHRQWGGEGLGRDGSRLEEVNGGKGREQGALFNIFNNKDLKNKK